MTDVPDSGFKDHFSGHAERYAAARPRYPDALFAHLAELCASRECAWDCATGNGQAALALAGRFDRVIATDASEEQVRAAPRHPRVEFRVAPAEASGLAADSIDLVTVAQALHWFDVERFFAEAKTVLRPGGILAYWCYGLCEITPDCDAVVQAAYEHVDDYWPPERVIVEGGYRDIRPPLPVVTVPEFRMRLDWTAEQMLGYLETWSATQRYVRARGEDPLADFAPRLRDAWGSGVRPVRWPIHLTVVRAGQE